MTRSEAYGWEYALVSCAAHALRFLALWLTVGFGYGLALIMAYCFVQTLVR